jgi:hypothetical protein
MFSSYSQNPRIIHNATASDLNSKGSLKHPPYGTPTTTDYRREDDHHPQMKGTFSVCPPGRQVVKHDDGECYCFHPQYAVQPKCLKEPHMFFDYKDTSYNFYGPNNTSGGFSNGQGSVGPMRPAS